MSIYGTQSKRIQDNYQNNASRFVEGKHYFRLEGEALREFKNRPEIIGFVGKQARSLTLWTERGAARHAKMLDTPEAWEVFEKLEDCYFTVKQIIEQAAYRQNHGDLLTKEQADVLRDMLTGAVKRLPKEAQAKAMIQGWAKLKSHFGVSYRQIPQGEFVEAVSLVARHVTEWEVLPPEQNQRNEAAYLHLMGLCSLMMLGEEYWRAELYPALEAMKSPFASRFYDIFKDGGMFARTTIKAFSGELRETLKVLSLESPGGMGWKYLASLPN